MKKIILSLTFVGGVLAASEDLNAFTAVTSGSWSNAATWGGVGPGSTVTNQDIIIPSGITVDLDQDVTFSGVANSFFVTGMLINTNDHRIYMGDGTITGSGSVDIHRIDFTGATSIYSFTGPVTADVLKNNGTILNLASVVIINDTLDLAAGGIVLGSGADLQLLSDAKVVINNGVITNSGGVFTTGFAYDVWYIGGTKFTGEELNSASVRDVNIALNSNNDDVIFTSNAAINGTMNMMVGHAVLNGNRVRIYTDLVRNTGAIFESSGTSDLLIHTGTSPTSPLEFSVGSTIDVLSVSVDSGEAVVLDDELVVTGTLELISGTFINDLTANLILGAGSTISIQSGQIQNDGLMSAAGSYNVEYVGGTYVAGEELEAGTIDDLTMDLTFPYSILEIDSDITVTGTLRLITGVIFFNDNVATVTGDVDMTPNLQSSIRGDQYTTILRFMMPTYTSDTVWMAASGGAVNYFVLDIPVTSTMYMGRSLYVETELRLLGGKIGVMDTSNAITMGSTASITYANDTNYIVTENGGMLRRLVLVDSVYVPYPIGTATDYTPIALLSSWPAQQSWMSVSVMDGVWTLGNSGTNDALTRSVVNKTWSIKSDTIVPYYLGLRNSWIQNCEVNGFDRTSCFMKHYENNIWDQYTPFAAGTGPWNTFSSERGAFTTLGHFAVVDTNSLLTVPEIVATEFSIYPNPSTDVVNVTVVNPDHNNFQYELFDATGRKVMDAQNPDAINQFDLRNFEKGAYTMRVTNLATNEVITKLIIKS